MSNYITQEEIRVAPYNVSQDEADEQYLTLLQNLTKRIVDDACHQSFNREGADPDFVEYKVDGTGKDTVFLPSDKRLIFINKVRVYVASNSYDEYDADGHEKYVSWNTYGNTSSVGRFAIDSFPKGIRNIGIVGTWGWITVPEPIKYLQGRLITKILREDGLAVKYSSENIGDYNYKLREAETGEILGDKELDLIIKDYTDWSFYSAI